MGEYWNQVAKGFRQTDRECQTFDYRKAGSRSFLRKLLPGAAEERLRAQRSRGLLDAVNDFRPDIVLVHNARYDFAALREGFKGAIVYWDLDGPSGQIGGGDLPTAGCVDLLLTVSKPVLRALRQAGQFNCGYLPNGVDIDDHRPAGVPPQQQRRFRSDFAFLGRPTPRRANYLEALADAGFEKELVVWGDRWTKDPSWQRLSACSREKWNIQGEEVTQLYQSARIILNISREAFTSPPNTLNLQVFHVPAAGGCVLTEWVEELEEAFDIGRELLCFRSKEEFVEVASRYRSQPDRLREIGEAGRKRCAAQHTLRQRAERIIALVAEHR